MINDNIAPADLFDLEGWALQTPFYSEDDPDKKAITIGEDQLSDSLNPYENDSIFYTSDGGLVLRAPAGGAFTVTGNSTRTELREMLRRGEDGVAADSLKNHWVLAPQTDPEDPPGAGGYGGGTLTATLAVNEVTTISSDPKKVGRVTIGQIHAKPGKPPLLLIYQKYPGHSKGSLYVNIRRPDEKPINDWKFDLIGNRNNNGEPDDGVELDEKFSYEIEATQDQFIVSILRDGKPDVVESIDIDVLGIEPDQKLYFKAGAYNSDDAVNLDSDNGGDSNQAVQVTLYELGNTHAGYKLEDGYTVQSGTNGDDTIFGGGTDDSILGGGGKDVLSGRNGIDTLKGGDKDDTLKGGLGDDRLEGGRDDDLIVGGLGNDVVKAGTGADTAYGGFGDDNLSGFSGNDLLIGGNGNDKLVGGSGADTLIGGLGSDVLEGGTGADIFVFESLSDSSPDNWDRVKGFDSTDKFDVAELGFTGIEYSDDENTSPDILRAFERTTGKGELRTIITDDSTDFEFYIVGSVSLSANNFEFFGS